MRVPRKLAKLFKLVGCTARVVLRGDDLYICYYTSAIDRDYPWILGMVLPSSIRMARVNLPSLAALAKAKTGD